jgi:hypothetical protein
MTENFAKRFVDHRDIGLAAKRVSEFPLKTGDRRDVHQSPIGEKLGHVPYVPGLLLMSQYFRNGKRSCGFRALKEIHSDVVTAALAPAPDMLHHYPGRGFKHRPSASKLAVEKIAQ